MEELRTSSVHLAMPAQSTIPLNKEQVKACEKELYSKECVAESIDHVVGEASDEVTNMNDTERISCYLATILARENEVVAVRLEVLSDGCKIYLSKNFAWNETNVEYIDKIENYLKDILRNAPKILTDVEKAFTKDMTLYCTAKLESRLKKLDDDIQNHIDEKHCYNDVKIVQMSHYAAAGINTVQYHEYHIYP